MFRPEVIIRDELCFFRPCAKLPSLPRTSEIHHVVIPVERSTSVYINLVRWVYQGFTFSLGLGVSPIAIVVCLINVLICSSGVTRVNFHLTAYTQTQTNTQTRTQTHSAADYKQDYTFKIDFNMQ